jgi:thymidylate synthase
MKVVTLSSDNLDDLILQGIDHIYKKGIYLKTRVGDAQQAYSVNYVLKNTKNRLHCLRAPTSIKYFARELIAYFNGIQNIDQGLLKASKYWEKVADKKGKINSNYGYYVFYEKNNEITQYEWIVKSFTKDAYTRQAVININQCYHKDFNTKDFPCTISLIFYIKQNILYCVAFSRSTDVFFGLPYDMGFFSFVHELIYKDLLQREPRLFKNLKLGSTSIQCICTQIYAMTREKALNLLNNKNSNFHQFDMPVIDNAKQVLEDIYNQSSNSKVMKWIYQNAK